MQPDAFERPPPPFMQADRPLLQWAGAFCRAAPDALRRLRGLEPRKTKRRSDLLRTMKDSVRAGASECQIR